MTTAERRIADLEQALEESRAETAAALEFLKTEMGWEYFREEMLYGDNEAKRNRSAENARLLKNYLADKKHGISLLRELYELRRHKEQS